MYGNGFAQTHMPFQQNILAQFSISSYTNEQGSSVKGNRYTQNFNYEVNRHATATSSFLRMSSPSNEKIIHINTAMLLVPNEDSAVIDKRELRKLGIQNISIYISGIEAANVLAKLNATDVALLPQVILCQEQLVDMTSSEFVILIRNHPQFLGIPVLALASHASVADEVNALASGFSALLVRPYSSTALKETIIEAECQALFIEKLKQIHMPTTVEKFHNALKKINYVKSLEHMPMEYFKEGLNSLRQKKWDNAIGIFQKSIRQAGIKGNSELGLAAAYKGKLNIERYKHYLNMACLTFAKNKQWKKARTVYIQLLKEDVVALNPFIQLAEYFIREGRFDDAASSLAAGHDLGSNNNLAANIAHACAHVNSPKDAIKILIENLRSMDMADLALQLQEQIIIDELNRIKKEKVEKQNLLKQINASKNARSKNILRVLNNENNENNEIGKLLPQAKEELKQVHDNVLANLPFDEEPTKDKKKSAPMPRKQELKKINKTSMSGLSEMLTVAKMTWKLFRK